MKKAIVDQILLGLFIFAMLIIFGATVSDNMKARDTYYNLKKITDNSVLTLAKYYVKIDNNTTNAENLNYEMLKKSHLGDSIKDVITYEWDFVSSPNTVKAKVDNYQHDNFWFKFLGLDFFNLSVSSTATIVVTSGTDPTSQISYGIAPFAINDQTFNLGDTLTIEFDQTSNWLYSKKDTYYPIITNCDCDCDFILSNRFSFPGFDVDNCSATSSACTTHGHSEFTQYANAIDDVYNSQQTINFIDGTASSPICLLGEYLGNDISEDGEAVTTADLATEISDIADGIYDIIGNTGQNLPIEMDFITLDENGIANGIVRFRITGYDFVTTSNPSNRYAQLSVTVVESQTQNIVLTD